MQIEIGSYSHVGMVRAKNEDSYSVGENFAVIADGMGGHKKGEIASKTAVEVVSETFTGYNGDEYEFLLQESVKRANAEIFKLAENTPEMQGMGTTIVACAWDKSTVYVANVGDSRCYLIRKKQISQISVDHSYVQQLVLQGKITSEEAKNRNDKNLILRAVGCERDVETDIFRIDRKKGDILVLCSDGLSNMIEDVVIKEYLVARGKIQDKVESLVNLANENGGGDNVTLVAIKFID